MSEAASGERRISRSVAINLTLLAVAAAVFVVCMVLGGGTGPESDEAFIGTDTTAITAIEAGHPDYRPWFTQVFAPPSAEVESGLFALQAALGAGVFGYALGALRRRRTSAAASPARSGAGDEDR